jgi:adenylate kinase family enzyme
MRPPSPSREWRFSVRFGVLAIPNLLQELASLLKVDSDEVGDTRGETATIVIDTDAHGRPIGSVAFSSLLWAMGRFLEARKRDIDFSGFDGINGFEARLKEKAANLLVERKLVPPSGEETREGELRPLEIEDLRAIEELIFEECGWSPRQSHRTLVRVKAFQCQRSRIKDPSNDILNSFIAADLLTVREAVRHKQVGAGLRQYLRGELAEGRVDLRTPEGAEEVRRSTEPSQLPVGRWPSKWPLALAQQFAVNRIMRDLAPATGLFAINGPPGTGKTTLLRDIVAAVVTERADRLVRLEHPKKAFCATRQIHTKAEDYMVSRLRGDLEGFGIAVASSNNAAVENVSRELPTAKAIDALEAGTKVELDYFADVSDGLVVADIKAKERSPGATWGIIAAVLGNAANKDAFTTRFWGTELEVEEDNKRAAQLPDAARAPPKKLRSPFISFPDALEREVAAGAIKPWEQARADYKTARGAVEAGIALRQRQADQANELWRTDAALHELEAQIYTLEGRLEADKARDQEARQARERTSRERDKAQRELKMVQDYHSAKGELARIEASAPERGLGACEEALEQTSRRYLVAQAAVPVAWQEVEDLRRLEPGWFWKAFWPPRHDAWQKRFDRARQDAKACAREESEAAAENVQAEALLSEAKDWTARHASTAAALAAARERGSEMWDTMPLIQDILARCHAAERRTREAETEAGDAAIALARTQNGLRGRRAEVERLRASIADTERSLQLLGVSRKLLEDWALHAMDESTRQTKTPWYDESLWILRHRAFIAALNLHKAFLAASRNEVFGNLRSMMAALTGKLPRYLLGPEDLSALWNTLFLAIPVVSTTFASLGRLFQGLGSESLGWLVIDEAGQAPPQAALGGIWRARRTVVVGDPLQVEPIVTIPEQAIDVLRKRCGVGIEWHPIRCSAQVLADRATLLGTELGGKWVGAPLRVHRRCLNPMFRVANAIAYDNSMVYGTVGKNTLWLGESCWIDVPASNANGHWIPAQGDMAARIFLKIAEVAGLHNSEKEPNVYVISPFKKVGEELRKLLINKGEIRAELMANPGDDHVNLNRLVGTVHTFQGKEASVVVLLLGGDPARPGAITNYAARAPNILNVALTRAKTRIYVVGDHRQWSNAPYFRTLTKVLGDLGTAPVGAQVFAQRAGLGPSLLENLTDRFSAECLKVSRPASTRAVTQPSNGTRTKSNRKYAVALSFAGEDRDYVELVASFLRKAGISVFYDRDEEAVLWGKNLYDHLRHVYAEAAEYTVIFVSKAYARKVWTNHERESAQSRAFRESCEYILPARFDDTELPGLLNTIGYIDLRQKAPEELASLIVEKLGSGERSLNARHSPLPDEQTTSRSGSP